MLMSNSYMLQPVGLCLHLGSVFVFVYFLLVVMCLVVITTATNCLEIFVSRMTYYVSVECEIKLHSVTHVCWNLSDIVGC